MKLVCEMPDTEIENSFLRNCARWDRIKQKDFVSLYSEVKFRYITSIIMCWASWWQWTVSYCFKWQIVNRKKGCIMTKWIKWKNKNNNHHYLYFILKYFSIWIVKLNLIGSARKKDKTQIIIFTLMSKFLMTNVI